MHIRSLTRVVPYREGDVINDTSIVQPRIYIYAKFQRIPLPAQRFACTSQYKQDRQVHSSHIRLLMVKILRMSPVHLRSDGSTKPWHAQTTLSSTQRDRQVDQFSTTINTTIKFTVNSQLVVKTVKLSDRFTSHNFVSEVPVSFAPRRLRKRQVVVHSLDTPVQHHFEANWTSIEQVRSTTLSGFEQSHLLCTSLSGPSLQLRSRLII